MQNNSKTVPVFNDDGSVRDYKLFSARLPEFFEKYPLEQGYRVEVIREEYINEQKTLLKLIENCIDKGVSPADYGLPTFNHEDFRMIVFTASLISPEGGVIECATAIGSADHSKSWEKAETSARQRLLAALGFSGNVFDEDEKEMINDQVKVVPMKATGSTGENTNAKKAEPAKPADGTNAQSKTSKVTQPPAADEQSGDVVPAQYLNQIFNLEEIKGVPHYKPATKSEAKSYLAKLHKIKPGESLDFSGNQ